MDYHLWRKQHQSEHLPSAKVPRLFLDPSVSASATATAIATALPLFVPEPYNNQMGNFSAIPDHLTTTSRFAKMGCFFSLAQWQELELQALIFKYMLAGATVPAELIQSIKKSLDVNSQPCYLHHPRQHFQQFQHPAVLQSGGGYWGRGYVDPETGRCRRTDGKKWRCSRDVVSGQKYCERHMHRGRNRSRKHVEITSTEATAGNVGGFKTANSVLHFGSSPEIDLLQLNQRPLESEPGENGDLNDTKHQGQVLWHFFDDLPKSQQKPNASPAASGGTNLFLKLSTGQGDAPTSEEEDHNFETDHRAHQLNWEAGWNTNPVSSMGGPLAEVLRSSSTSGSPISVLHEQQLPCGSRSQTSSASI